MKYNKKNKLSTKTTEIQDYNSKQDDETIETIFQQNVSSLTDLTENSLSNKKAKEVWQQERGGGRTIKVIRKDNKTLGFISYAMNISDKGYIYHLGVEQHYKGQRYGQKLLNYAINDLISQSKKLDNKIKNDFYIQIYITRSNVNAIKFFTNNNFIINKEEEDKNHYIYKPLQKN